MRQLLLIVALLLAPGLAPAAEPEVSATQIFSSGVFALPKANTRAEWHYTGIVPIRLLRMNLWFGLDIDRKADLRMTIVRERGNVGTLLAVVPIDRYTNTAGYEIFAPVDLSPGVVIQPGDVVAILYSGEPVFPPPAPAPATRAHFGIVTYWIPELP